MIKNNRCNKILCLFAAVIFFFCIASGCKLSFEEEETQSNATQQESVKENKSARKAKAAIIQYMNYTALNECCEGVKHSLDASGIDRCDVGDYPVVVATQRNRQDRGAACD